MEHMPMYDMSDFQFAIELDNPTFAAGTNETSQYGRARVDFRVFYKPHDGEEETIYADYIVADLKEWIEEDTHFTEIWDRCADKISPYAQQIARDINTLDSALKFSRVLQDVVDPLKAATGQPPPALVDGDVIRNLGQVLAALEEEYALRDEQLVGEAIEAEQEEEAKKEDPEAEEKEAITPTEAINPSMLGRGTTKKAVDLTGIDVKGGTREKFLNETPGREGMSAGIFMDNSTEPLPLFIGPDNFNTCEHIIEHPDRNLNSYIVLGRDRPSSVASGYGGKGDTQAFSMDLVVGRMASYPRSMDEMGEPVLCNPDFINDAARIYISQKCDIDNYFNLATGVVGNSTIRSGIGVKADGIRLVAREGIKLVTGVGKVNSQGKEIRGNYGIDLIAGNNDTDMQPIPKGANLGMAIQDLAELVADLAGCLNQWMDAQAAFNSEVMTHTHKSPFYALDTTPSIPLVPHGAKVAVMHKLRMTDIIGLKTNIENFKIDYLSKLGSAYINSRYNNTN